MGTLSLSKTNRLYWLGRYHERVFTTLQFMLDCYDRMIDGAPVDYVGYCSRLGIPCAYTDAEDFVRRYLFDPDDPNSVRAAAEQMLGNGMVLRETISSPTLSYLQMAVSAMNLAAESSSPSVELQWVLDDIMAFRGSFDDYIDDENTRNIIKCGASVERISLFLRLNFRRRTLIKELHKLLNRLYKTKLPTNPDALDVLQDYVLNNGDEPRRGETELIYAVEHLFAV